VGIVAARLVDRFYRPAFVMAIDENGVARGSARSIGGLRSTGARRVRRAP
jgi:single-stranded-DNA-specific exonuclease